MSTHSNAPVPRHDRGYLLSEGKRNDVLALWEVERYGRDREPRWSARATAWLI